MKKKTIQHPERYEAPRVKVKMLRRRASLLALSVSGGTESMSGEEEDQTEGFGLQNMGDF